MTKSTDAYKILEDGCNDTLYKVVQAHKRYDRYLKSKSMSIADSIRLKEIGPLIVKYVAEILKGQITTKYRLTESCATAIFHTQLYMPVDIAREHLLNCTAPESLASLRYAVCQENFENLDKLLDILSLDIYIPESRFIESAYSDAKQINRIHRASIGVYTCAFVFKFNYTHDYVALRNHKFYPNG